QLPVAATRLQVGGQLESAVVAEFVALGLAHQCVVIVVVGSAQQVAQVLDVQCVVRVLGQNFAIEHVDAVHAQGLQPVVGAIGHDDVHLEFAQCLGQCHRPLGRPHDQQTVFGFGRQ